MKQTFEPKLTKLLSGFFAATEQHARVIRLKQPQPFGSYQDCDILVLSALAQYRLAIECKSVLEPAQSQIYFSSHFTIDKKGTHQITRMTDFCSESGMRGILAVELRSGKKWSPSEVHFVPWRIVRRLYVEGEKGLSYEEVRVWPTFCKVKGVPNLDDCLSGLQYSIDE
jgi:hypothetical protein